MNDLLYDIKDFLKYMLPFFGVFVFLGVFFYLYSAGLSKAFVNIAVNTHLTISEHNDSVVSSVQSDVEKKYPGYEVKNIHYPTLSNGYKTFEFLLLKDGKVKGHVYVDEFGEMTDEIKD